MILDKLNKKLIEVVANRAAKKGIQIDKEILSQINFEMNDDESHGDYSTSCALKLAKTFSMNPREVAESLIEDLTLNVLIKYFRYIIVGITISTFVK